MQWLYILLCAYWLMIDYYLWKLLLLKVMFSNKKGLCVCLGCRFYGYTFFNMIIF